MSKKIYKGQVFGVWKLKKHLGNGGNGDVWLAVNSENQEVAVKLLREVKRKTYARFIDEVNAIKANSDVDGILPILDSYLPENLENEIPWYVMPVAQPLEKYLDGKHFEDVVTAIENVAKTLHELHQRGISHRDIKPENLLVRNGKVYLADFGLVDYPDKINVTSSGDAVGAKWTMAPEMRREGNKSDGKPADVYSLAKTLWILITKNKKGFDGQYHANGINGLRNFSYAVRENTSWSGDKKTSVYESPIDDLMQEATSDNPSSRPTIKSFIDRLKLWIVLNKDWKKRNPIQWQEVQKILFPSILPTRAIWEDIEDIIRVLNILGKIDGLNHMFYPEGGGMDLVGARIGREPKTIELIVDRNGKVVDLVKPRRLIFESFGFDTEWNYFRLENEDLTPSGVYESLVFNHEELLELSPLVYVDRVYSDEGSYNGNPLPKTSRIVDRHFKGDFVVFQKFSKYNRITVTYDGRHNKLNTDEFRRYIAEKVKEVKSALNSPEILGATTKNGIDINDFILSVLRENFREEGLSRFNDDDEMSNVI